MYLCSPLCFGLLLGFAILYNHLYPAPPGFTNFRLFLFLLLCTFFIAFFVGMIGTIVTSYDKGKAAGAVFGLLAGIGLLVASFFIIREEIQEGFSDFGHMMVFGVLPIPLVLFALALPFLGAMAFYKSIKALFNLI